jgi:hypothetical protein
MAQQVQTSLMIGGLDLATAPIAMPPGRAIAAINYEPDVSGYTSMGGYERFDGQPRPSDVTDQALVSARRGSIREVPGIGPVRGVWVFDGYVFAFRDQVDGAGGMFRSSNGGWSRLTFGSLLPFFEAEAQFEVDDFVVGVTSGASAKIDRIVTREGNYDPTTPTAAGYLIVSNVSGTFADTEAITSTSGGAATSLPIEPIVLKAGGRYSFTNHNFYGSAARPRMYFANGVDTAFEWTGSVLSPIRTGITDTAAGLDLLLAANDDPILAANGDSIIVAGAFDAPSFITHYKNHLFLAYTSGTLLFSSPLDPLDFRATTGAGELSFGQQINGILTAASTSLVIFAQNRVEYLTGDDDTSFVLNPLSDVSGAKPYTIQMLDAPFFLDDGGVRKLDASSAFGDWRMGTQTQQVEKLMRQKRDALIQPVASLAVKAKDQYRLFWDDGSGITLYIGRKAPEALPFKVGFRAYCACAGEVDNGRGDRLFVGAHDGFVYELNRGTSYDGAEIQSYIRLPFTAAGSPSQATRWMKATFEMDAPDDTTFGVAFDVDYGRGLGGEATDVDLDAGSAIVSSDLYANVDWSQPVQGVLEYHIAGIGPNIAATLIHNSAVARQHTISSQTYNFSRRGMKR